MYLRKTSLLALSFLCFSLITIGMGQLPDLASRDYSKLDPTTKRVEYQRFDSKPLKFSARAQFVLVPVVVLDKNGKRVAGLKKEDFRVFESGKEQKISSVDEIRGDASPLGKSVQSGTEFSNETKGSSSEKKLTVIALDLINTPFLDQTRARQAIISYLADNIEEDTLYELIAMAPDGVRVLHEFTTDTKALINALKRAKGSFNVINGINQDALRQISSDRGSQNTPVGNPDGLRDIETERMAAFARGEALYASFERGLAVRGTLEAFQQVANRSAGIPGRKSVIWVTGSFPFIVDPESGAISEGTSFGAYQHTMQLLADANVAVYPIDARGLVGVGMPDASVHLTRKDLAESPEVLAGQSLAHQDTLETMRAIAEMTGGRAYFNTNDIAGAVRDASNDGAEYYMLSYPLDKSNIRPGWRKLKVRVGDGNLKVRARSGYFATQATIDATATAGVDINNALISPMNYTALPLHVKFDPPAMVGNKRKVNFALLLPANSATIDDSDANHFHVDIAYQVRNEQGKEMGHNGMSYNLKLDPLQVQQLKLNGIGYNNGVELLPGHYNFHFVVRDNISGKVGSVVAPIEVR